MEMIVGYTTGIFDLFHVGHLNILKKARENCDYLIVGLASNNYCKIAKGTYPIINYKDRKKILEALSYVDKVIYCPNKFYPNIKIDIAFKGSDWKGSKRGKWLEAYLKNRKIKLKYFNYTKGISSSVIKERTK